MISIVGSGYVGLTTGVGLAMKGHKVICVDRDKEKVNMINSGKPPIYEDGLEEGLKNVLKNNFEATTDLKYAISNSGYRSRAAVKYSMAMRNSSS